MISSFEKSLSVRYLMARVASITRHCYMMDAIDRRGLEVEWWGLVMASKATGLRDERSTSHDTLPSLSSYEPTIFPTQQADRI